MGGTGGELSPGAHLSLEIDHIGLAALIQGPVPWTREKNFSPIGPRHHPLNRTPFGAPSNSTRTGARSASEPPSRNRYRAGSGAMHRDIPHPHCSHFETYESSPGSACARLRRQVGAGFSTEPRVKCSSAVALASRRAELSPPLPVEAQAWPQARNRFLASERRLQQIRPNVPPIADPMLRAAQSACYRGEMDCPVFLAWSRTLSRAESELESIKASRPRVRGTSRRFENELERAESEISWTKSWIKDHIRKCEICKAAGATLQDSV